MAVDTIVATLACCLLALSFAVAQTENSPLTVTTPTATTDFNLTQVNTMLATPNSMADVTDIPDFTGDTTQYTSTSTSQPQTSQSTTMLPPLTNSTTLKTTTPTTHTSTSTALTTQAIQTTAGNISTPDTPVITTENSTYTVSATSQSLNRTTKGLGLNTSEKNMTIVFSAVLGVFAAALLMFMFHKCKHKIQFMHQPLHNTENTDAFVADDDTLVISGGLYDGHPIYDNVPTATGNQSQFRLDFI